MELQLAILLVSVAVVLCGDDQSSKVTTSVKKSIVFDSRKQDKRGLIDFGYGFASANSNMNTNTNNPSGTDTFTGRVISDHTIITNQVPVTVPHPVVYHLQVTKPLSAVYQAQPVQFRQVAVPVLQVQQVQQQYPLLVTKRYSNPADNNPIQGHFFVKAVPASQLDFAHGTGFIGTAYDGYGRTDQNLGTIQVLNN